MSGHFYTDLSRANNVMHIRIFQENTRVDPLFLTAGGMGHDETREFSLNRYDMRSLRNRSFLR